MLILKYTTTDPAGSIIIERLQEMTLAFRTEENEEKEELELFDGTTSFKGLDKIQAYLDDLQKDLKAWYYCNC